MESLDPDAWALYGATRARAGIVVHAPDTSIRWVNAMASELLGLSQDALTGKVAGDPAFRLLHADGKPMALEDYPVNRVLASGEPLEDLSVGVLQPGRPDPVWGLLNAEAVRAPAGELSAVVVTFVDITDLQTARAQLARSEQRLALAVAGTSDGLFDVDLRTGEAWWAARFEDLLGLPPGGLAPTSRAWAERVHPDDMARLQAAYDQTARDDEPYDVTYRIRHADGGWRHFRVRGGVARDDEGVPTRVSGAVSDVTEAVEAAREQEATRAQLEEAARLEGLALLAGGVAHDFNNLLVGVLGAADTIQGLVADQLASEPRELLDVIAESATRGAELTRQLTAYAGRAPRVQEVVSLAGVATDIARLVRNGLPAGVNLVVSTPSDTPPVEGDPTPLRQLVLNLMVNAGEAIEARWASEGAEQRGRIRVTTAREVLDQAALTARRAPATPGTFAVLVVEDDGAGMDSETLSRLFEPYFTTKGAGHGLGLAAAQGLARAYGGYLSVTATLGRGARFELGLPAAEAASPAWAEAAPTPTQGGTSDDVAGDAAQPLEGRRVWVVDDDTTVRRVVAHMLEPAGVEVTGFEHGVGLAGRLARQVDRVDAVLLDLWMPGRAGAEVLRALRAQHPELPVVLMSGHLDAHERVSLEPDEPTRFLAKPFRRAQLAAALAEFLAEG